ncbi:hypothetical protein M404DRAFT_629550 [Pisolithus tinctorius Marx 270]|uniref:Uncharacterized protein n=1 Tax=Pisolithus tinctorius Marx 270 TaxID=870435 RepID=A0A0C3NQ45_PISTI|nr:hypothetical protein M404DRAFT_629550 [Pisolithus tinctorius Marx 270]
MGYAGHQDPRDPYSRQHLPNGAPKRLKRSYFASQTRHHKRDQNFDHILFTRGARTAPRRVASLSQLGCNSGRREAVRNAGSVVRPNFKTHYNFTPLTRPAVVLEIQTMPRNTPALGLMYPHTTSSCT